MSNVNHILVAGPITTHGGAYKRLSQWFSYMPENVHLTFLYWSKKKAIFKDVISANTGGVIEAIHTKSFSKLFRILVFPMLFTTAVRIYKDRPVQIVSNLFYGDMACLILNRIYKILHINYPFWTVYIAGDPVPLHCSRGFFAVFYKYIARSAMKNADRVVFLSSRMASEISAKYSIDLSNKYEIVPIAVEKVSNVEKKIQNLSCLKFGVVSRLEPVKRVSDIISAFNMLIKTKNLSCNVQLDIWGDGSENIYLQDMTRRLGLSQFVSFHGWVDNPYEAFEKINILVMASQSEGTPRSILEAGSLGVPSIASRVGGIEDIIEEDTDGWLINVGDIEGINSAMKAALDQRTRTLYGETFKNKMKTKHFPGSDVKQIFY